VINPIKLDTAIRGTCHMMAILEKTSSNKVNTSIVTPKNAPKTAIPPTALLHKNLLPFHCLFRYSPKTPMGTADTRKAINRRVLTNEKPEPPFKFIPSNDTTRSVNPKVENEITTAPTEIIISYFCGIFSFSKRFSDSFRSWYSPNTGPSNPTRT
jgi:hypothetical protein